MIVPFAVGFNPPRNLGIGIGPAFWTATQGAVDEGYCRQAIQDPPACGRDDQGAPDATWHGRESEFDSIYVLGRTADGVKIRILYYRECNELEAYWPPRCSHKDREAFLLWLGTVVLTAVGATGIADGP